MALQMTVLALTILTLSLRAAAMTTLPECNDFRLEMREENILLFVEGKDDNPLLEEYRCLSSEEGVVSYFTCKPGYKSVPKNIDDPEILGDPEIIFNINELRSLPGNEEEDYVVDCLIEESQSSEEEMKSEAEEAEAEEELDEFSSTPVPSTKSELPLCSDINGTNKRNNFQRESRSRVCELRCRFPIAVFGMPAGFRTRRIFTCCDGEPQRVHRGRFAPYTCPNEESENQEETKPKEETQEKEETKSKEETQEKEETKSKEETQEEEKVSEEDIFGSKTISSSTASVPTTAAATPSANEKSPNPISTSKPAKTTSPPLPLCSEVNGVSRRNSFRRDSRESVCEFRCRFPVAVYGQPAGFRSRRFYTCCEGEPQATTVGRFTTYSCP